MPKIKYYVTYGYMNQELMDAGGEAIQKAMEKWTKTIEETGLKMVFWGSPFGVPENTIVVTKGAVDDYTKLAMKQSPYTTPRTNIVMTFP